MRSLFITMATICRFFAHDIWEKDNNQDKVDWDLENSDYLCGTFR